MQPICWNWELFKGIDIVYICFKEAKHTICDQLDTNIIICADEETGDIVSVEIIEFQAEYESGNIEKYLKRYTFYDACLFDCIYSHIQNQRDQNENS